MLKDGVGELQDIGEFGLGLAPRLAKPVTKIELSKAKEEEIAMMQVDDEEDKSAENQDDEDESKMEIIRLKKQREKKRRLIDRQSAFIEFKQLPEGKSFEDAILNNRNQLKEKKLRVKILTENCNGTKKEIDMVKQLLDKKAEEKKQ